MHGSWMNAYDSFAYLSPRLARAGFCVFALNYGQLGVLEGGGLGPLMPGRNAVGPMAQSARQLADFVDRVLGRRARNRSISSPIPRAVPWPPTT